MCSIKFKLMMAIGLPLLIAFLAMAWCEYRVGRREALAAMESHLKELVEVQASDLDGDLRAAEELARAAALFLETSQSSNPERIRQLLQDCLRLNANIFGMCAAFEESHSPEPGRSFAPYYCREKSGLRFVDIPRVFPDFAEKDWFLPAKQTGRPCWTEPYFDIGVGQRIMCTYTVPLLDQGKFRGVVTIDLSSDSLLMNIARRKLGDGGYCSLVSRKGAFISHPDSSLVLKESIFSLARQKGAPEGEAAGARMIAGESGTQKILDRRSGEAEWMVFAPLKSTGWSLAVLIPEKEVMAAVHARLIRLLGLLGAGLAVILGIVVLVSARITSPLRRIALAAESLGRGNLEVRVPIGAGRDEVSRLARTFNAMAEDLRDNIQGRIAEEAARKEVQGELNAARDIQASLLPAPWPADAEGDFSLHAVNLPAKLVAGDFYDFFLLDDRQLALVIADVSGKGPPAAMYMAVARTKLRDFAAPEKSPAEVIAAVNRSLAQENNGEMFVSIFLGYYEPESGELAYANAGHNPPYLVRQNGCLTKLGPTGPLAAVFPQASYETVRCRLEFGDLAVLYTDGITEADRGGIPFGEERLEALLPFLRDSRPEDVSRKIVENAVAFQGGDLPDDATVLVLKRNVPSPIAAKLDENLKPRQAVSKEAPLEALLPFV